MAYYPHFSLLEVCQDAFEIHGLAEEEEEDEEDKIEEKREKMEEEGEEAEEEEEEAEEEEKEVEAEEEEAEEEEEEEVEEGEWEAIDGDTTLSASLKITLPSFCPSPPYTFSSSPLMWGNLDEVVGSVAWMPTIVQSPQSFYSPTSCSNLDEEHSSQEEETLNNLKLTDGSSWRKLQNQKVTELVNFLILKYRMKEPIKKVEMLSVVTENYEKQFPIIFEEASKCLEMIFGIDIKECDPVSSSYVLTNSLNLTYDEMVTDNQRMPRNGFLIVILGVIFIEGSCASEESMWKFLNMMGIYDGEEHFIYGEPREFLTRDLVYQNYLKYQQVPKSYPPRYEFLWGPRAYSETTKMKVLEFMAKMTSRDPTHFSCLYSEAFRDEGERA
ncbi:melanoma-associated antigen 1-like [Psammomys obesus]|uniref:melanoma-associated antigen 1-like n=1 Tax=Psammomys obesus TaxID=48139 RepID=UPI0024532DB4|nr:melanoma-associated antigen 1-like [Psammomys obesus]XP_055455627.1 melanoma-associated antigen 1-like [Psammomys obesus]XP_055455628.1 melanoma-associated antigen 1-like [Psammomys obesus]XP_055455629.1 melanoma-associated antigen 1-like [Psammomys obesus]XP_055455630.1 melanoma-associated antigen 1-like [Psammomys obesus]